QQRRIAPQERGQGAEESEDDEEGMEEEDEGREDGGKHGFLDSCHNAISVQRGSRMSASPARTDLPWIDRIAQSFELRSFVEFHRRELPHLIERHAHLVARDLRGAPPLAFRAEDGATFSWIATDDGVRIVEGDAEAATLVELPEVVFSDFVHELLTASGAV